MARITKPLTTIEIEKAKPKAKDYSLTDGQGLYLLVKAGGAKLWRFNYYKPFTKKRTEISLGAFPEISLQQARAIREEFREILAKNIDPQTHRQNQVENELSRQNNTFGKVAVDWFEWRKTKPNFSEKTAYDIWRMIERKLFPHFGEMPITEITSPMIIRALKPLEEAGTLETLKRCKQKFSEIMDYALNREIIQRNPLATLSKEFTPPKPQHFKTIKPEALPDFLEALNKAQIHLLTRYLILWQLLTITRPNEAATARFCDIDEKEKIWTIVVKKGIKEDEQGRTHKITLSRQAMALLNEIKKISRGEFLFSSPKKPSEPYDPQTANSAIKRMGYKGILVAHGLRSIASTYLNEKGYPPDLIEVALSHINKDKVRMAYNRAEYIPQRFKMLQDWADFIDDCSRHKITQFHLKLVNE